MTMMMKPGAPAGRGDDDDEARGDDDVDDDDDDEPLGTRLCLCKTVFCICISQERAIARGNDEEEGQEEMVEDGDARAMRLRAARAAGETPLEVSPPPP